MADWTELVAQFLVVAFGALAGSTFMWMVLGPYVAKRGMNNFMSEAYDLTEEELSDPKKMMKAITKAQTESMASGIYGALGNVMQTVPTEELAKFASANPGMVQQFLGNGNGLGGLGGLVGMAQENGGKNPFGGIVQLMLAMNAMSNMGGEGGGVMGAFGGGNGGGSFRPGLRR